MNSYSKCAVKVSTKPSADTALVFAGYNVDKSKKKHLVVKGVAGELLNKVKSLYGSDFKAEASEVLSLRAADIGGYKNVVICGLGSVTAVTGETLRRAAGTLSRDLKLKNEGVEISYENLISLSKNKPEAVEAFTEGSILGAYKFDELKSKKKDDKKAQDTDDITTISVLCKNKTEAAAATKAVTRGGIIAEAVNFARRLGDLPGNYLTPTILAEEAQSAAKGTGVKVTVWDRARCEKEKMGNFIGVAKGSDEPCKFIILEYKGAGAKQKPVCFVGKGLTFDSGGISLKPGAGMEEMKYDMCGGANVLATMLALGRLKSKINAIAFIPSTENMPNGSANKPGDVTIARNGKTAEVNNTDAEGRLILSDALCIASEHKPSFIVDAATLTGAMTISLGDYHCGYFTNNDKLRKAAEAAASAAGESIWQMPLVKEHHDDIKGAYADLTNISYNKGAGSAKGAAFLAEFVDQDIPWAHFDIAAVAWNTGHRAAYNPKKGASGTIVRTFITLAETWKP